MSVEYHHMDKWAFSNLDLIEEALETKDKAVILISGASSSGKSYAAEYLTKMLSKNHHRSVTISLDSYNVGLSRIIPNKVNDNYFDHKIEKIDEIERRIKEIIYDVPFDQKYDKPVLAKIRKKIRDLLPEKDLNPFVKGLYKEWKVLNFDEPTVYDLKEASEDIKKLYSNRVIQKKEYSKVVSERVDSGICLDGKDYDVILVEGIYAMDREMMENLAGIDTIKDFIDGNPKSLFLRRVLRDIQTTSARSIFTIALYFKYIVKSYQETIYPCRSYADVILNNDMTFSEMRQGNLYRTKEQIVTKDMLYVKQLLANSEIQSVRYLKDTYFNCNGENMRIDNILRLRSVSEDEGLHYQPSSLVHKGVRKIRKDNKEIRPINILLNEEEFKEVWKSEEDCLKDFRSASFVISAIVLKKKYKVIYKGQKLTIRIIENREAYIEFTEPIDRKIYQKIAKEIGR